LKAQHPGVILFFRMGDFYETFDDDARLIADVLDIALTSREMGKGNRIPMAGIPYHSADGYLSRLLAAGHRVAIAEQLTEPDGKGIVEREVTRIVTPGTVTAPELLTGIANAFVAALISDGPQAGIAFADASTGEFATATLRAEHGGDLADAVRRELLRIQPREIVVPPGEQLSDLVNGGGTVVSDLPALLWRLDEATETLLEHFNVASLEPFGCDSQPHAARAAGALLAYLRRTQLNNLRQIRTLYTYSTSSFMSLDTQTRRNLEIDHALRDSDARGRGPSLLDALDVTLTPGGGRLLRRWLGQPLLVRSDIEARYDGVQWFAEEPLKRGKLRSALKGAGDIERIINRVVNRQAGPRELARLGDTLGRLPLIVNALAGEQVPRAIVRPPDCSHVAAEIERAIGDEPPAYLGRGEAIRTGYSAELDGLRRSLRADREYIAGLESRERAATGIERMKVGYNKVFGYYLEISNANRAPVPEHYIRKQTLVNAERYITPELKEAEQRVAAAEERIAAAESAAFDNLLADVGAESERIRECAFCLATLDVLAALGEIAAHHGYVRPEIVDEPIIEIDRGRHPIVERERAGGAFVPNDTRLGADHGHFAIITGPNMAGKSTYLRQVALLVLLAQIGSFVPAERMRYGVVDRIFTRIGAQDDLASGQSTFMVEMLETATILNHATDRSLIVLDEIGRGTSTYDGLAIATAIVEYIHNTPRLRTNTLFATHYHELTALADTLPGIRNYRVDVLESGDEITFLYRVVPGGADKSYGVYVAQLAGMPRAIVRRAEDILTDLERNGAGQREQRTAAITESTQPLQMQLFGGNHPAIERIRELELDAISPLEAITRLYELKRLVEDDR
jgi:DNA mismatch repair protein MutS